MADTAAEDSGVCPPSEVGTSVINMGAGKLAAGLSAFVSEIVTLLTQNHDAESGRAVVRRENLLGYVHCPCFFFRAIDSAVCLKLCVSHSPSRRYAALWLVSVLVAAFVAYYVSNFPSKRRDAHARARMRRLLQHRVLMNRTDDKSMSAAAAMLRKVVLPDEAVVLRTDLFGPSDLDAGHVAHAAVGDADWSDSASSPSDDDDVPEDLSSSVPLPQPFASTRQRSSNELRQLFETQTQLANERQSEREARKNRRRVRSRSRKRERSCCSALSRQSRLILSYVRSVGQAATTPKAPPRTGGEATGGLELTSPRGTRGGSLRIRKRQIVVPERLPKGCEPVIVFINSKSGGECRADALYVLLLSAVFDTHTFV